MSFARWKSYRFTFRWASDSARKPRGNTGHSCAASREEKLFPYPTWLDGSSKGVQLRFERSLYFLSRFDVRAFWLVKLKFERFGVGVVQVERLLERTRNIVPAP